MIFFIAMQSLEENFVSKTEAMETVKKIKGCELTSKTFIVPAQIKKKGGGDKMKLKRR
jgi:hypothetical protein